MISRSRAGRPLVRRLTVQAWLRLALALMVALVLIGGAAGAQVISQTRDRTAELVNHVQPSVVEAYRLQAALVNQETGVRGYAIAAVPSFLEPFENGVREEQGSANRLRELLIDHPALTADVDAVQAAARQWRESYAEPLIRSARPGNSEAGKAAFDQVRTRVAEQNARLERARVTAHEDMTRSRTIRNGVLLGSVILVLLAVAATLVMARRHVADPLRQLEHASRRVASGEFDHHIPARGPSDVATTAAAVEQMRERVVAELASARSTEAELARQAAALDAQAMELRRSNLELEQFAYVASHDLQEPLRKVASFCQLLEKRYGDRLDDRGRQYVDYAVDGAKRMQVLINDLLTFSRVGRVDSPASSAPVTLDAALDAALGNLAVALERSGARIARPAELPALTGDATLLVMLWQNLLGNAVKFAHPDRAPVIVIEAEHTGEDIRVTVSDNGIGIEAEFAEKVFVIFQRLHNRGEYEGTGIGLAICRKIVDHHGGRIWIDTDHVEGARFCFTLPAPVAATAS